MPWLRRGEESRSAGRVSSGDHTIVPQQRFDARLAPAEGAERFRRGTAAADGEDLVAETLAGRGAQHAVRVAAFLERAIRIGREPLGPFVAVIARRVAA